MKQLTKDPFPKHKSSSYNSIPEKQTLQSKRGKKDLNRHSSKEDIQMDNKYTKDVQHRSLLEKSKSQ